MSYKTKTLSPFRTFSNDSTIHTYSTGTQLDDVILTDVATMYSSVKYKGFSCRPYSQDRGVFAHASQSWTQGALFFTVTDTTASTAGSDTSLQAYTWGWTAGALYFGDDALFWATTDLSTPRGPALYASLSSYYPTASSNASSNFAILTFTVS